MFAIETHILPPFDLELNDAVVKISAELIPGFRVSDAALLRITS